MRVLATIPFSDEERESIRALGYELKVIKENYIQDEPSLSTSEVLICHNPFSMINLDDCPQLKWIQLSSAGCEQAPMKKIKEQNIMLTCNRGAYSIAVAEWIVLKILEIYKNSAGFYHRKEDRIWAIDQSLMELYGKRVIFIGTGTIANEAARRLSGFGVELSGINDSGEKTEFFEHCYDNTMLDEMLPCADVVVLALPYTNRTYHLFDKRCLNLMKDDSILINVSRGEIIDENELIEVLKTGKFKGVALDVFEKMPLSDNSPLWSFDRVLVSAHNSWVSEMRYRRKYEYIYDNLRRYIDKIPLNNLVNLDKAY